LNWPETAAAGVLGDDRPASATDRPADFPALRQAVVSRVEEGYAIYPQAGRTSLEYGGIPRRPGVAIDLRSINRVIDYPYADMTITVEAGLTLSVLQAVLAEHRQRLPVDAPRPGQATLGGIFATNTSGPRRLGEGRPRDMIIGVNFVTSTGAVVKGGGRVVKNVAGYDLPKLLTGSLGTLGIITQLTLKIRPRPETSALAWAAFDRVEQAADALEMLNTSATRPIAIELLNPSAASLIGGPLGLPGESWTVVVGYEDNAAAVTWQMNQIRSELAGATLATVEADNAQPLWDALADFPALDAAHISLVANLRPSAVASLAEQLEPGRWAVQTHAGNGIVRCHLLERDALERLAPEVDRLRIQAIRSGGNLIVARCPTAWKERLRVWGEPRADWWIAERIKHALDPLGAMNPGRFIGRI
jgi:glycolate dehydrogenase FAD-binding subunit